MKEERKSFQKHEQTKKRKKLVLIKHLKRFEKLQQKARRRLREE